MTKIGLWSACALAMAGAAFAAPAAAQECQDDGDCAEGLICKTYTVEVDCARPLPEPCADGKEGGECAEFAPDPECEGMREYSRCELPPCTDDSDCPAGTVCHAYTYEECSAGGAAPSEFCPDGQDCGERQPDPEPVEPTCQTRTSDPMCTPRHLLPCESAADCGDGFTCEEIVRGSCSSGAGTGGSSGSPTPADGDSAGFAPPADGGVPEPREPVCTEERTGEFRCKPAEIDCDDDSMCPDGWTCEEIGGSGTLGVACTAPAIDPVPPDDGDTPDSDSEADRAPSCEEQQPVEVTKLCQPPYAQQTGGVGRDGAATGGLASRESDDSAGEAPPAAPVPNQNAGHEDGDLTNGKGSGGGACSTAAPGSSGGSALVLIGLGLWLVRRRRAA